MVAVAARRRAACAGCAAVPPPTATPPTKSRHFLDEAAAASSRAVCRPTRRAAPRGSMSAARPRPRAGARLRLGEHRRSRRRAIVRYAVRRLRARARRSRSSRADAGRRHRRHHRDLQRRQSDSVRIAAVPERRRYRQHRRSARRRRANGGTFAFFRELIDRSRTLEAIAVVRSWQPTLSGAAEPERLDGQRVSASYFPVLGVAPAIGRTSRRGRSRRRSGRRRAQRCAVAPPVRRRSGDRRAATVTLDDAICTVVGVMPAASRTCSRRRPRSGCRCSTTDAGKAGSGATTCERSRGCGPASTAGSARRRDQRDRPRLHRAGIATPTVRHEFRRQAAAGRAHARRAAGAARHPGGAVRWCW